MSSPYADAQQWARDHSLANVPILARLEGFAFQGHPDIVATFGPTGAAMALRSRRSSPLRRGATAALTIGAALGAIAPVAGVAFYAAGLSLLAVVDPLPATVSVPAAGVCFAVAAVMQLVLWGAWLRERAVWSPLLLGVSVVAAIMAAFALIGLPVVAERGQVDLGGWLLPVGATLALSAPLAAGVLLRHRVRPPEPTDAPVRAPTLSDREGARMLVRELPAAQREAIQADRDAALQILAERGLLDAAELQRAREADLGTLFTLDPIRRETS